MMATVGVRELKARLSRYLKRVGQGERVIVTDRGHPIAVICPAGAQDGEERIAAMMRDGAVHWNGGRPRGSARPAKLRGASVAEAIIEDRR